VRVAFVPNWTTVTVAPATVAPEESVTVPVIDPVIPCPNNEGPAAIDSKINRPMIRFKHHRGLVPPGFCAGKIARGFSDIEVFIFPDLFPGNTHGMLASWARRPECLEYWVAARKAVGVFLVFKVLNTVLETIPNEIKSANITPQ
jgi:hypothetical protein